MVPFPAVEDFQALPPRMIVALGTRCGLRVRPLYWGGSQDALSLDKALQAAEKFLGIKSPVCDEPCVAPAAHSVPEVAQRRAVDTIRHVVLSYTAATLGELDDAIQGSLNAISAAANAAASYASRRAVPGVTGAADEASRDASARVAAAAASDFDRLLKLLGARGQPSEGFGDPIETGEDGPLGPLWPDGPPEDWPC
jgi:hypothetical protein